MLNNFEYHNWKLSYNWLYYFLDAYNSMFKKFDIVSIKCQLLYIILHLIAFISLFLLMLFKEGKQDFNAYLNYNYKKIKLQKL